MVIPGTDWIRVPTTHRGYHHLTSRGTKQVALRHYWWPVIASSATVFVAGTWMWYCRAIADCSGREYQEASFHEPAGIAGRGSLTCK